jgi:TnpA family transposase
MRSTLHQLRLGPGAVKVETLLDEIEKLQKIEALRLPEDLFANVSSKVLESYRQRVAVEELHEVKRHPAAVRYTLLAAYCWQRRREIIDTMVDLLLDLIHRMQIRAERRIDKIVLKEVKRVQGKGRMLYNIADAAVENPSGQIRDVIYPVADKQSLQEVIDEYEATGEYDVRVRTTMRSSYGQHYRQMVPAILNVLTFRSNNKVHQPVVDALHLLQKYASSKRHEYPVGEEVPLDGVVPEGWRHFIVRQTKRSGERINRINYELCVLRTLRDKVRCKEIWIEKADRYRNPDDDIPANFNQQREQYFTALNQPTDVEAFIKREKEALSQALQMFNDGLPKNDAVEVGERHGKSWITLSPLKAVAEAPNLGRLKAEVKRHWEWTSLLDMLKETDLRVNFSRLFKSATAHENLPRDVLQKRLLLCLYGLGTNTGLSRIAAGDETVSYRDLQYIRRRYLSRDGLRAAIAEVANGIFQIRQPEWWGEETTACASDGKKFGAWDQNLLTEWHVRYRGPGILVYWHVEKNAVCIYSQVKRCSSSEVAAMIEGVLRHCTDMQVTKNYVDTHGQSEVAFAFTHLLGFELMPRLKGIGRKKLYLPDKEMAEQLPQLEKILVRRPINWELIRKQYDEMVKYATALRLGTADAEAILRRFTKNGVQHPTYRALQELGRVRRTVFLCHYLHDESVRREIQAGLNVIENWNSANTFIFYGRSSELTTNKREDQELAVLSLHLLQICLVYINTLMMQQILKEASWQQWMGEADRRGLTPLFYRHVTPYGIFRLDLEERLALDIGDGLKSLNSAEK